MTNREAAEKLEQQKTLLCFDCMHPQTVWCKEHCQVLEAFNMAINALNAQPETHEERTETYACDCISRKEAIDALIACKGKDPFNRYEKQNIGIDWGIEALEQLPSSQPEHTNSCYTNCWCIDCKEYDTENKCCPRYNRVIKQTLDEIYAHAETEAEVRYHAQQRWIPCSERLPEER